MGMLLTYHEGYFPEDKQKRREPDREPDAYDALTDEQVAEAYATNVGGNATSRNGRVKALRKLDAEQTTPAAGEGDNAPGGEPEGEPAGGAEATPSE